ncbi:MAG: glycine cleavage system protein GcvH [Chloroflexota bacterium]
MSFDKNAKYSKEHEWVRPTEDEGIYICGISDHAQEALGDVVYVELPEVGESFAQDDEFGTVESVKAVSELFIPMSGEITEVNDMLEDAPELVNDSPYGDGWIIKFRAGDAGEWDSLLSPDAYAEFIG